MRISEKGRLCQDEVSVLTEPKSPLLGAPTEKKGAVALLQHLIKSAKMGSKSYSWVQLFVAECVSLFPLSMSQTGQDLASGPLAIFPIIEVIWVIIVAFIIVVVWPELEYTKQNSTLIRALTDLYQTKK